MGDEFLIRGGPSDFSLFSAARRFLHLAPLFYLTSPLFLHGRALLRIPLTMTNRGLRAFLGQRKIARKRESRAKIGKAAQVFCAWWFAVILNLPRAARNALSASSNRPHALVREQHQASMM